MSIGPGKYDSALTFLRTYCEASQAVLIVLDGKSGPGFSVQSDLEHLVRLPAVLRNVADQIESDLKKGKL